MAIDPKLENIQERVIAAVLMAESAGTASKGIDTFATWLLAGFGGGVALLLGNHDALSLVPIATVRAGLKLFVAAVIATVIQKYLAFIVSSGAGGAASGRVLVKEHIKEQMDLGNKNPTIDVRVFAAEMVRGLYQPGRWIASRLIAKSHSGDFSVGSRALLKIAQIQGLLLILEIVLFLVAVGSVVRSLPAAS